MADIAVMALAARSSVGRTCDGEATAAASSACWCFVKFTFPAMRADI